MSLGRDSLLVVGESQKVAPLKIHITQGCAFLKGKVIRSQDQNLRFPNSFSHDNISPVVLCRELHDITRVAFSIRVVRMISTDVTGLLIQTISAPV